MSNKDTPTSFDALAHEHNLSDRMRDLAREFFKLGLTIGKRQAVAVKTEQKKRLYNHITRPAPDR
jgi:hypothetical protein